MTDTNRIKQRAAEIERECPGSSVSIVRVYEDGSALLLYTPPEEDRALDKVTSEAWGRVTRPVEVFVPAVTEAPDRRLN